MKTLSTPTMLFVYTVFWSCTIVFLILSIHILIMKRIDSWRLFWVWILCLIFAMVTGLALVTV